MMEKSKKTNAATPEAAQEGREPQVVTQDIQEPEAVPGFPESGQTPPAAGEIIGPEDPAELLGCQEDDAELAVGLLAEYVVAAKRGLNLREEPRLDAPILAVLPCGAGVFGEPGPAEGGWRQVKTGRLAGWVMDKHLEALPLTELTYGAG